MFSPLPPEPKAEVMDRFELLPLIDCLPIPFSRLTRRRLAPVIWDIFIPLESGEDCLAAAETFECCVSPRIQVLSRVFGAPDCDPNEMRITFYVRPEFAL